jgi:hypothetical protein
MQPVRLGTGCGYWQYPVWVGLALNPATIMGWQSCPLGQPPLCPTLSQS